MKTNLLTTPITVVLFVLSIASALTQNLDFRRIKVEEGLPHSTVNDIAQDREGFIWIGTAYGLNIYDPVNKSFEHSFHDPQGRTVQMIGQSGMEPVNEIGKELDPGIYFVHVYMENHSEMIMINKTK